MSDVPEGYRMSEVGVIPVDWGVKTLGEKTTKIGSGITPTGGEKVYKSEGRPFLRSQNVGWGNLILEDIAFIDDEIHNTFKATEIEKNDVFLNITGASIGRSTIADERVETGNVNQHVCIIRTIENELNPKFLNYFLLSKKGQKQIDSFQAGGNRQGLNFRQIKSFQIPTPPLPEQQAIASALSDVDALITALEQLITKKRNIKQGAMQQLLTGEKRLPGFGGGWEVKTFEDIADKNVKWSITGGPFGSNLKASEYTSDGVRIVQLQNIGDGVFNEDYKIFTSDEKANELLSCNIYPNEIILSKMGDPVARACFIPNRGKRFLMSSDGIRLVVDESRFAKKFVHDYINSIYFRKRAIDASIGSTRLRIGLQDLKKLFVIAPPLPEQTAIAQILSDMDAEIESLEKKRDKYKAIKQGMMQELLTGKTRLV